MKPKATKKSYVISQLHDYFEFFFSQSNIFIVMKYTWMTSSTKANDLITDYFLVNGYEQPIVVFFNEKGEFHHNLAMRSTGILVVVDIPEDPWAGAKMFSSFRLDPFAI